MTWENTSYNGAPHSLNMRKEQTSKRQPDRATQDTIRQGKRPHIDTGKGNLMGRKESQEQAEESEINLLPFSLSPSCRENESGEERFVRELGLVEKGTAEVKIYCMREELIFNKNESNTIKEEYKILKNK